jgi:hypothetical protein
VATELSPKLDEAHAVGLAAVRALSDQSAAASGGTGASPAWTPAAEPAWRALVRSLADARSALTAVCDVVAAVRETLAARPAAEFGVTFAAPPRVGAPSSALDLYLLLGRVAKAHEDDIAAKEVIAGDLESGAAALCTDGTGGLAAFWEARVYVPADLGTDHLRAVAGV